MTPVSRLLAATVGCIYLMKVAVIVSRRRNIGVTGLAAFLFFWPGIMPDHFLRKRPGQTIDSGRFLAAWCRLVAGAASIALLALYSTHISDSLLGLAGTGALLLTIHLGLCGVLPWLLRWACFQVPELFDRPWRSRSLSDFWSRRWNLAFIEMNRRIFLRRAHRWFGARGARFALFALSGVLHELALSFPAKGGWGLPLGYFLLQGALVWVEEQYRVASRVWTWFWLIAPSPWLFHEPFRRALVVPLFRWLHGRMLAQSFTWYLSHAIYAAAGAHLVILIASAQAPFRLRWKTDLAKLTRFNRKVFWVYGFYIVLCIVAFALLTWRLHDAPVAGESTARWLAGFIAVFWTTRVFVDVFWFDSRDWPPGNALVVGHALLTTLFVTMSAIYWCAALV